MAVGPKTGTQPKAAVRTRLNAEWLTLNAIRETMQTALRTDVVTYEEALMLGRELSPRLFSSDESLIGGQEPAIVREYRQWAELENSQLKKKVTALDLVQRDIKRDEHLLTLEGDNNEIGKRLSRLRRAEKYFRTKRYSENRLIVRDVFQAERAGLPAPDRSNDDFVEFKLPDRRILRLRMLHPDLPEHLTGADLIYEHCDLQQSLARFSFVQYKIWDGRRFYFKSSRNFAAQLKKLKAAICGPGYCKCSSSEGKIRSYRLPHCAAFLRLTDELQSTDARLISSGHHMPVCMIAERSEPTTRNGQMLTRRGIHGSYVSTRVFEELFNNQMLGSTWFSFEQVEKFYRKHKILDAEERLVIYAQEYAED